MFETLDELVKLVSSGELETLEISDELEFDDSRGSEVSNELSVLGEFVNSDVELETSETSSGSKGISDVSSGLEISDEFKVSEELSLNEPTPDKLWFTSLAIAFPNLVPSNTPPRANPPNIRPSINVPMITGNTMEGGEGLLGRTTRIQRLCHGNKRGLASSIT